MRNQTLSTIAAAALLASVAITPSLAADKIALSQQQSTVASVAGIAVENGYFKEAGIDFQSSWALRGIDTIQSVGAGQADFGIAAVTPIVAARASGLKLVIVGLHSHGFPGFLIASKKNAGLKKLEDFKGKKIGVQVGTGAHTVLLMAIESVKLKPSDFQIQNVRVNDMPGAMQGGTFDAVLGWVPFTSRILKMGTGVVAIGPKTFEEMVGITYPLLLITTEDTIKKRPDAVQRFMNAWVKAQRFADKDHAGTVRILRKTLGDRIKGFDDATLESMIYVYAHDRTALTDGDVADVRKMRDYMAATKKIKTTPDLATLIDNSFAKKAEATVK